MQIKAQEHSEEEGFFPNKIQIKQYSFKNTKIPFFTHKNGPDGVQFSARYLSGNGLMTKQPLQVIQHFDTCLVESINSKNQKKKKNSYQTQHPYLLYAKNENYKLIYNKTRGQPITFENQFIKNEILLEHLGTSGSMSKKIKQFSRSPQNQKQEILILDSRFECGNLHCAYKHLKKHEYIGFIQNDTNSLGYNQWFYFSVENNKANTKYQFKLVNFKKKHSFFKYGYMPAVFSKKKFQATGEGWSRKGDNIIYEESPMQIPNKPDNKYYSLSFELNFQYENDLIFIAMGLPYSYSKMMKFLGQCVESSNHNLDISVNPVAKTICGNDVPELTITSNEGVQNKKVIIIMARQHPGQVWSSYMAQGMIKSFLQPQQQQKWLLENYIIKIFPMVNVDGVIYGNFRCDIAGVDLNRRWKDTSRILHPQVYYIKKKIAQYHRKYKVELCFDLHGHSKDYNIFCYSCKNNIQTCRILPLMISKANPNFHFPSCTFGVSPYKQSTARAAIYREVQTENVLTIQTSFYGSKLNNEIKSFQPKSIYKMGVDILKTSRNFLDKKSKKYLSAKKEVQEKIKEFLEFDKVNENNSGSDSSPSADEIDFQTKANKIFGKNLAELNKGQKKINGKKRPKGVIIKKQYEEDEKKDEKQKITTNKVMVREIPLHKNPSKTINHQEKAQKEIPSPKKNKVTISYSQQKQYGQVPKVSKQSLSNTKTHNKSNLRFRQRKKNFSVHHSYAESITQRKYSQKQKSNLLYSSHKNEHEQQIKQICERTENQIEFAKKFEKFIPISMKSHQPDLFHQALYNQDQTSLINTLLENKKKIEVEKIKRDVQKSTYIVERQGKIKSKVETKKQQIVDFRKFKENERISKQIRNINNNDNYRYIQ